MDVTEILDAHKAQFKPITVEKPVPVDFDINLLAGFDTNALDEKRLKAETESYVEELTRDNVQLLFNEIYKLPTTSIDTGVLVELPKRTSVLPREKPVPKNKPMTKWEKFAKAKGIKKRKKERLEWNEEAKEFLPRWGYGSTKKDANSDKP